MIRVVDITDEIIHSLTPRECFSGDPTLKSRLQGLRNSNGIISGALVNDKDQVIALIGVSMLWPGVAECWSVTTDLIKNNKIAFCKKILEYIDFAFDSMEIHRMHMTVKANYLEGMQFANFLGFKSEAYLAMYGPDRSDYIQYVRF